MHSYVRHDSRNRSGRARTVVTLTV